LDLKCKFHSEALCQPEPGREQVCREHAHPAQHKQPGEHQTNRTLPGHEHPVPAEEREAVDSLEHCVHWLQHRPFQKGIAAWNFYDSRQHKGHHPNVLRVAAAGGLKSGGDTGAFVLGALSKSAVPTRVTFEAGNVMMQRNTLSLTKPFHPGANPNDRSGRFMSENARWRDRAKMDFLDVGRTDSADGNFNEQFTGANRRHGHGLGAKPIGASINHRLHRFRNREHGQTLIMDSVQATQKFRAVKVDCRGTEASPSQFSAKNP
jgi:hypothetical protein